VQQHNLFSHSASTVFFEQTFALAHINRAFEVLGNGGSGGEDASSFEEPSKKASQLLRTAAGVLEYLVSRELPRWTDMPKEKPMELDNKVCGALVEYCCAQAQCIAMKKGLLTGITSTAVLAKLAVDVWNKVTATVDALKSTPGNNIEHISLV
jgi:hypothetical protein